MPHAGTPEPVCDMWGEVALPACPADADGGQPWAAWEGADQPLAGVANRVRGAVTHE